MCQCVENSQIASYRFGAYPELFRNDASKPTFSLREVKTTRRISCTVASFIFISSGIAQAAPVLVGSFDFNVDTQVPVGSRFGFVLQMLDADNNFLEIGPPLGGVGLDVRRGPEVFWGNGESGVRLFTPSTFSLFDQFAELLTDGIDDSLIVFWQWEDNGGFGGNGALESELFGLQRDLVGASLDVIKLTVNEVSIGPRGFDTQPVRIHTTYEFFGTPVPEPGTLVLLVVVSTVGLSWRMDK